MVGNLLVTDGREWGWNLAFFTVKFFCFGEDFKETFVTGCILGIKYICVLAGPDYVTESTEVRMEIFPVRWKELKNEIVQRSDVLCLVANKHVSIERGPSLIQAHRQLIIECDGTTKSTSIVDVCAESENNVEERFQIVSGFMCEFRRQYPLE